jgi:hypothetical protein
MKFHYRWAARRCLRMIEPNSRLKYIVIEGSKEPNFAIEQQAKAGKPFFAYVALTQPHLPVVS